MASSERKLRDKWETGEVIPLPREVFDRSLSDATLQDRWVAGAEKKLHALYADRQEWLALRDAMLPEEYKDGLGEIDGLIEDAEEFVKEAKAAQRRYHQTGWQRAPVPAHVQALMARRTPVQVQALLKVVAERSTEIVGMPTERITGQGDLDATLEAANRRPDDVLEAEWHPLLPKPEKD